MTRDSSWIDRLWSIVPVLYVAIFALFTGFSDPRLVIMMVLVLAWGMRLTFSFARKGGYSGVEDYRWPISRHPNFFFEQAQWWFFALFAVSAAGTPWVWTWLGAILLTLLFIGSTIFTESITVSRYPEYAEYRRTTSMLIPLPPRRSPAHHAA